MVVGLGVIGGSALARAASRLLPQRVAAAAFENRTGRPDLDDLGAMAADWMIRGLMETPLVESPDLEAVYTRRAGRFRALGGPTRPRPGRTGRGC